jgi:GNAT superfamily N-acetyltransferase
VVAATPEEQIAAFCTIFYDDATRSAVTILVGTAKPHQRRGLGKALLVEGMHRLKHLGCLRVFAKADDRAADALYTSVMSGKYVSETWIKDY